MKNPMIPAGIEPATINKSIPIKLECIGRRSLIHFMHWSETARTMRPIVLPTIKRLVGGGGGGEPLLMPALLPSSGPENIAVTINVGHGNGVIVMLAVSVDRKVMTYSVHVLIV